ncbi:MAG: copper-binding protein [Nitrosopumilaceae archaeon]|nr:copper-binding protein [Nitrosopumilaceae archaeon]
MSSSQTSHAYGVGLIALLVAVGASTIFYTSYYLPESLAKPSVSEHILHPAETFVIEIVMGAVNEGADNYVPNKPTVTLEQNNLVKWINLDETPHTVSPDHRTSDSYSGDFGSAGVLMPGEEYEFLFTEPQEIHYHCQPHPWMTGVIIIEKGRF